MASRMVVVRRRISILAEVRSYCPPTRGQRMEGECWGMAGLEE